MSVNTDSFPFCCLGWHSFSRPMRLLFFSFDKLLIRDWEKWEYFWSLQIFPLICYGLTPIPKVFYIFPDTLMEWAVMRRDPSMCVDSSWLPAYLQTDTYNKQLGIWSFFSGIGLTEKQKKKSTRHEGEGCWSFWDISQNFSYSYSWLFLLFLYFYIPIPFSIYCLLMQTKLLNMLLPSLLSVFSLQLS